MDSVQADMEEDQQRQIEKLASDQLQGLVLVMSHLASEDLPMVVDVFLQCVVTLGHRCAPPLTRIPL